LPSCSAVAVFAFFPVSLGPGACMDTCFVPSDLQSVLRQGGCSSGELCVPCTEPDPPLGNGLSTGACD
jgi:hypothetical protein